MTTNPPILLDPKDPEETVFYTFDFSGLLATSESIASYVLETPAELTATGDSNDGKTVTVYYSGGLEGSTYRPRCRITTDSATPQVLVRSLAFPCRKL